MSTRKEYNPADIENKWSAFWVENKIFETKIDIDKKKMHVLDMFPYPSGEGLHAGHCKIFSASDAYSRMKRMQGYNVLHSTGWDAFGLPAEQFAIKNKVNPKISTQKNVDNFRRQMKMMGFSYDWDREVNTTDPKFYKWTQWIFLKLYEKGMVSETFEPINWCPSCKTGLANEDLEDGKCERCGSIVEKKPLRQWSIRITDYAEKLLKGVDDLNWRENIKDLQRNWIGKSQGSEIIFALKAKDFESSFTVFTTRPDTLFGCTYCVLSPEHELVKKLILENKIQNITEVQNYIEEVKLKTEIERSAEGKEKTGVKLEGVLAVNPANNKEVRVYIADYVLSSYGTGAIMAVPAHDQRDYEFAQKFNIEILDVVAQKFGLELPNAKKVYGSVVIAYDKNEKKFLKLINKKNNESWMPSGGLNDDETYEECAKRELAEEAGISEVKDFIKLGSPMISYYYNINKDSNRESVGYNYLAFVDSKQNINFSHESHEDYEIFWTDFDDLYNSISKTNGGTDHWLEALKRAKKVIDTNTPYISSENGFLINSDKFNGMTTEDAKKTITDFVNGKMVTKYKLRDWTFARQRYWGEPFPLVHIGEGGERKTYAVDDSDLPVLLPEVENYEPTGTGESPLAGIDSWVNVRGYINEQNKFKTLVEGEVVPNGKTQVTAKRESNTMPQWAGSSWYWLRYMDPNNDKEFISKKAEEYWKDVDIYLGGLEHATRHLIYARFWHQFLFDEGYLKTPEPFTRLEGVGLVLGEGGTKMSKRLGNIVNPDDVVERYGADTMRTYLFFMGAFHDSVVWNEQNIIGSRRFLERVWLMQYKLEANGVLSQDAEVLLNQTIKKVTEDNELLSFNTSVSALMILLNTLEKEKVSTNVYEILLKLLSPFAPFITEEIWQSLGARQSIHVSDWPKFDDKKITKSNIVMAIQIAGKVRGELNIKNDATDDEVKNALFISEIYQKWVGKEAPKKIVIVKNRIVNVVL